MIEQAPVKAGQMEVATCIAVALRLVRGLRRATGERPKAGRSGFRRYINARGSELDENESVPLARLLAVTDSGP